MTDFVSKRKKEIIPYFIGLLILVVFLLPYFILGKDASFRITDFLDDEIIQFKLSGKYFFTGFDTRVLEWMGGIEKSAIQPTCFLLILPFKVLPFYYAVLVSYILDMFFAYSGMYLLLNKILKAERPIITVVISTVFCMLPFYPSYGVSSIGIPMVIWAVWEIYEKKNLVFSYIMVCVYALYSSLVWSGFFVFGFTAIFAIVLLCKKDVKAFLRVLAADMGMLILYIFVFKDTFYTLLFTDIVSHRDDPGKIVTEQPFKETLYHLFKYGQYHSPSAHTYIMAGSIAMCIVLLVWMIFSKKMRKHLKPTLFIVGMWVAAFFIAVFAAFYGCDAGLRLREHLGPFESIQLSRVYWLYPTIWYVIFALCMKVGFDVLEEFIPKKTVGKVLTALMGVMVFVIWSLYLITQNPEYASNLNALMGKEKSFVSYNEFYDEELFADVKEYIGKDVSEYRVIALGFAPAVTSANGFYTLDAYSTNYDLEYKKKFRTIMEKELEKNEAIRGYYDNWGSRCYLFSAELGLNWDVYVDMSISNLELNVDALHELGADYIFSAVKIENAEDNSLVLTESFDSQHSNRTIYIYAVE